MTDSKLANKIVSRLANLKAARKPHEKVWKECFDYSFPIRGVGIDGTVSNTDDVQRKKSRLFDSTLTDAAKTQASAIISGLTPANALWFGLTVNDVTEEESRWLDTAANTIWRNIHNANFDSAAYEGMLDLMAAGWFVLYIDKDQKEGGFNFQLWPLASVYCDTTRADGVIDVVYRCYELTAEQVVNTFEEASEKIKKQAEREPSAKLKLIQAIYPRHDGKVGETADKMPIASVHVLESDKEILRVSGYNEMPVVVPRWMLIPQSVYAISPVSDALPDAKTLNEIKKLELANADLAISGMWIAEDDGVLNPRTITVGARKIIVANSVDSMKPLVSGADFNVSFTKCEQLQAAIRKIMLADQLQPKDSPAMTATEVNMRQQLIRQLLGPIYGRMQSEYLQPLIDRCFGIAFRAGILGNPPETLPDKFISIKYVSPLARAQKFEEVTAISNFIQMTIQSAQVNQEVLDNIDFDKAARFTGEALGVPSEIIRTEQDVATLRQARAEAQAKAQADAMANQAIQTGADEFAKAGGQNMAQQVAENG